MIARQRHRAQPMLCPACEALVDPYQPQRHAVEAVTPDQVRDEWDVYERDAFTITRCDVPRPTPRPGAWDHDADGVPLVGRSLVRNYHREAGDDD